MIISQTAYEKDQLIRNIFKAQKRNSFLIVRSPKPEKNISSNI